MAMATALIGCLSAPAFAEVDLRALSQRNMILQQQDTARLNALSAQREAQAAQSRYDTQLTLRALDEGARRSAEPSLRPALSPIPPRTASAEAIGAELERMDRLTDERLAESNDRLRAMTPAH
jgi:hypothetical protein